jgi:hypothetical protein
MSDADQDSSSVSMDIDTYLKKLEENKVTVPEIDFTVHEMDDGSKVSTLDRYCKESRRDDYLNGLKRSFLAS